MCSSEAHLPHAPSLVMSSPPSSQVAVSPRPPLHSRPPEKAEEPSPSPPPLDTSPISLNELEERHGSSPDSMDVSSPPAMIPPHHAPRGPTPPAPPAQKEVFDWELTPEDVQICKRPDGSLWRLGSGGFGEVFKGVKDSVDEVAIKVIRIHMPSAINEFKREIDLISKLRHRHVLQFYGACVKPTCLYMVTELMQTDLFSALRLSGRYHWAGEHGRAVVMGVACGLHYLHSRRPAVVHRDIKSPNVLLLDGVAKIADVGIARTKASSDMTAQRGFTMAWAAPEVVYRKRATEKIDVWSFGVILWEVVSGRPPHPGLLTLTPPVPVRLRELFQRCTAEQADQRPSAAEIITELKAIG